MASGITRTDTDDVDHVDVVVVGAGLSGIGAGYRLQTECPDRDYVILEAREAIGGTWDLFRYPGVRSDSDMFTLGYPFEPWRAGKSIADGATILQYVRDTAARHGVDRRIRFNTKVVAADWSTETARWRLTLQALDDEGTPTERTLTCGFLYSCAGYYHYDTPHDPEFPGMDSFAGAVVHPQFWPEGLDYAGKQVCVIGSGATAVTLVPAMADQAAQVTMVQRSPTWMGVVPTRDKIADRIREKLPADLAHRVIRVKNVLARLAIYQFCRRRPAAARRLFTTVATRILQDEAVVAEHFTPTYEPWDQRLCALPDADLFKALKAGKARIVTDHVDTFVPEGVRLRSGQLVEADLVVTATGLRLQAFGGMVPSVDGRPVALPEQFVWRGAMITGMPNFAFCMGYTNASWTLRADLTSRLVCKVLNHMTRNRYAAVVPAPDGALEPRPLIGLTSGYVQRSIHQFPRQGHRGVWRVRQNYVLDSITTMRTNLHRSLAATPAKGRRTLRTVGRG